MDSTLRDTFKFKDLKQLIGIGLILGVILGFIFGIVKGLLFIYSNQYLEFGMYNIALYYLRSIVNYFLLTVPPFSLMILLALFLIYFILATFLKNSVKGEKYTYYIVITVIISLLLLMTGYRLNKSSWYPAFFSVKGIFYNTIVLLFFISLGFISFQILPRTHKYLSQTVPKICLSRFALIIFFSLLSVALILNISIPLFHKSTLYPTNNVIILLIDCLRADHISSNGYSRKTTPNIDKFAEDSVMFTQAISQGTYTKTSMASLFTSRYPYQHGMYKGNWKDSKNNISSDVLGKEETTLAEVLLQNGFLTTAWIEQAELTPKVGFAQGFVEYNDQQGWIEDINNKFTKWINETGKKEKFFAYIHYIDLHDPYRPKPPYDKMYGVYSKDVYSGINFNNWKYHLTEINKKKRKLDKKDIDQLIAYYDSLVTYIDSQVGILLEGLKKQRLYDNTLIILTADHGDGFMEHGFISHSNTPYEELIRVPLIIKFPNSLHAGKVVKRQVRSIDVMPTILDFLGIKANNKLEGFSLMKYLDDSNSKINFPKYAYSENAVDSGYPTLSIRTEKFKFIHFHPNWGRKDELYDLSVDPKEQNNIIDLKGNEAEKFYNMALDVVSERQKKEVEKVALDKNTIEKLKALGYVQ